MNLRVLQAIVIIAILPHLTTTVEAHGQHKSLAERNKLGGERIKLSSLSSYKLGPYNSRAAEIAGFDPVTQRVFVTNGHSSSVDAVSLAKLKSPRLVFSIDLKGYGTVNSLAVNSSLIAIAVNHKKPQLNGTILIYNTDGKLLNDFKVGPMPDMVTFSPDGKHVLSANEGQPNDNYTVDPEGSISIIDLDRDITELTQASVRTADFKSFNSNNIDPAIRIFGKNASIAQDLEPEYISVTPDSSTAWVSLQENNALAEVSIKHAQVKKLYALGYQDHSLRINGLDASDKGDKIEIKPWPIKGMYQPDSIASYEVNGDLFIVSANEGSSRDYPGFSEIQRVKDLHLEPALRQQGLQNIKLLGRLEVSTIDADTDHNGRIDTLYSFGSRSFSIWDQNVKQIFDSASQFEQITARDYPTLFNQRDRRSDDKGPEPEALTIGQVGDSIYAFIGLERTGGVMVYNITRPEKAFFVDYLNTISPHLEESDPKAGDIAPEGLVFVSAADSPNGKPFLISANEVSGTLSIYKIDHSEPKNR